MTTCNSSFDFGMQITYYLERRSRQRHTPRVGVSFDSGGVARGARVARGVLFERACGRVGK